MFDIRHTHVCCTSLRIKSLLIKRKKEKQEYRHQLTYTNAEMGREEEKKQSILLHSDVWWFDQLFFQTALRAHGHWLPNGPHHSAVIRMNNFYNIIAAKCRTTYTYGLWILRVRI